MMRLGHWRSAVLLAAAACGGATDVPVRPVTHDTTITVLARRRNGDVVPGAPVVLYGDGGWKDSAATGADGRHTFRHLTLGQYYAKSLAPAGYAVTPQITCPPSRLPCSIPTEQYLFDLTPAIDSIVSVPLTLYKRGPGTVIIHVTGDDGKPLPGLTVHNATGVTAASGVTNAAGNAVFTADFGRQPFVVERPYLYREFIKSLDSATKVAATFDVEEGTRDSAAVVLAKCAGTIRVVARDEADQPVRGILTRLANDTVNLATGYTDGAGEVNDFPEVPCVVPHATVIVPVAGSGYEPFSTSTWKDYTKVDLFVTNGAILTVTYRVPRA
jgi:hypothetical protein